MRARPPLPPYDGTDPTMRSKHLRCQRKGCQHHAHLRSPLAAQRGLPHPRNLDERGWITHLATNGAGTIHDFEYAHHGRSTESVEKNVASGTFGSWEETGRAIMFALARGALDGQGYGSALGRWIAEDGMDPIPMEILEADLRTDLLGPLTGARHDYRALCQRYEDAPEKHRMQHPWKASSILAQAYQHQLPFSVHPGIGYDIITNHPSFMGSVVGRAASWDFDRFCEAVDGLDGGVVLSIGSAIMGPQVFEKSLSCVHNVRFQRREKAVQGHQIYVVDLQDGGGWDWARENPQGQPRLLPALLQELLPHGRSHAIRVL